MSVDLTEKSYRQGACEESLRGLTIGAALEDAAHRFPDNEALVSVHQGVRFSYTQLDAEVDACAVGLVALGVGQGDRVALWSPNCAEWVIIQYATAKIGAILVSVNPAYRPSELAYVLGQSGSRVLISAQRHKSSDYPALVEQARHQCPDLEHVIFLGSEDWDRLVQSGRGRSNDDLRRRSAGLSFDDAINIQYTSGTTGAPKGATLTHHGLLNNGYFVGVRCRYTDRDRICVPVPYYHCFGMVSGNLAALTHGACVVLPGASFEPATTLRAVAEERCTALYGVPTMFVAELALSDLADYDLSSLRTGIIAGAPSSAELMTRIARDLHLPQMTAAYGMTETSPMSTQTFVDDPVYRRTATVGAVHPHIEVAIVETDTGLPAPCESEGELWVRGYSVMRGYWNDPQATAEVIDHAGWMHTGDLARMDRDGYVAIIGRIKDMIIRGGENIYPKEIEDLIGLHPDVESVQVIGVPHASYGEEVMAWVKLRAGAAVDAEQIREHCNGKIAHFKIPKHVHFLGTGDEFPLTVTGKVKKDVLKERASTVLSSI
jgi:fatty-acyl-CoA synthase